MSTEPWTGNKRVETPTRLGFSLWTRPALLDETVIAEVIDRDTYRLASTALLGQTVIDCGAHVGAFATMCAYVGATVIAIEPQPENLELLRLNTAAFPDITVVPSALGTVEGFAMIAGESGGTHVEPGHVDAIEVPQTTLHAVLDWMVPASAPIAVLKLDMEGSEVDVLCSLDRAHLARCHRIVLESHGPKSCPWVERPRVGEVIEHLLPTHNVECSGDPQRLGMIYATRNGTAA